MIFKEHDWSGSYKPDYSFEIGTFLARFNFCSL